MLQPEYALIHDGLGRLIIPCGECDGLSSVGRCGTCTANAEDAAAARQGISHATNEEDWGDRLTRNLEALDG